MTDTHLSNEAPEDVNPLEERLRETHAELFAQMAQLEEKASEAPKTVDDDKSAEELTDLASQIQKLEKRFEAVRVDEKADFLASTRTVDSVLGAPPKTLNERRKTIMSRVDAHHRRKAELARQEAARIAEEQRQEAIRIAAEAEAARLAESHQEADQLERQAAKTEATADAQEAKALRGGGAMTRTEGGARSYQVKVKTYRFTDAQAFRASFGPMAPYLDKEAVAAALGRAAKAEPPPTVPGVEFYENTETRVR